jgi:hypothetical protein
MLRLAAPVPATSIVDGSRSTTVTESSLVASPTLSLEAALNIYVGGLLTGELKIS